MEARWKKWSLLSEARETDTLVDVCLYRIVRYAAMQLESNNFQTM